MDITYVFLSILFIAATALAAAARENNEKSVWPSLIPLSIWFTPITLKARLWVVLSI